MMKRKPTWWKLYLFAAAACAFLFIFPPANHEVFILWMIVMYGGVAVWLHTNQTQIVKDVEYRQTIVRPVAEFLDEDRLYLQSLGTEIADDNLLDDPHEVI